jgi:hypothetical protein
MVGNVSPERDHIRKGREFLPHYRFSRRLNEYCVTAKLIKFWSTGRGVRTTVLLRRSRLHRWAAMLAFGMLGETTVLRAVSAPPRCCELLGVPSARRAIATPQRWSC